MSVTFERSHYTQDSKFVTEQVTVAEGATLRVWRDSIQVMSDLWEMTTYAQYWDEEAQALRTIPWVKEANVDATTEVLGRVKKHLYKIALAKATQDAKDEVARIHKGSQVRVIKGRTDRGAEGRVVVSMTRPYGMGYRSVERQKLGIATSEVTIRVKAANGREYDNHQDMVWVWAHNCELVDVPEIDRGAVTERAVNMAKSEFARVYRTA